MTIARESLAEDPGQPGSARPGVASWYTPGLSDGLGDRLLMFDNSSSIPLELLRFPRPFSQSPTFEAALRGRIDELKDFFHPSVGTIRSIQWLGIGDGLALVSNQVMGRRLSDCFGQARGPAYATELLRQLTAALSALEQHARGVAHGAINADRIIITEAGRLVLVEHVLGSALGTLYWPPSRTRTALDVPMPDGDRSVFDNRTDIFQLAFLALSVTLGRRVHPTDDPRQAADLLAEACRPGLTRSPLTARLRHWIERALLLEGPGFASATDAYNAFHSPTDDQPELKPAPPVELPRNPASERPIEVEAAATAPATVTRLRPKNRPDLFAPPRPSSPAEAEQGPRAAAPADHPGSGSPPWRLFVNALPRSAQQWLVPGLVVLLVVQSAAIGALWARANRRAVATGPAALFIDSPEPGAVVTVDGKPAGVTPSGSTSWTTTKAIRVQPPASVRAGSVAGGATVTSLDISSEPIGARVTIDGRIVGATPVTVPVDPGTHEVILANGSTSVSRTVTVGAGTTAMVMAALPTPVAGAGWVTISSPVELQILEGGSVIGTTGMARLMLPAGKHDLMLANAALGFQSPLHVDVSSGKTATSTVTLPNGSVSINALPWAAVSLDGKDLGSTPLANLDVPLGSHEVVLRHPQLGERRQTILVTAKGPVRLVIDLSKK